MFKKIVIGIFLVTFLFLGIAILSRNQQKVVPSKPSTRDVNLNIEKSGLKIGYITDLHCYSKLNSETKKWEVNWRCSQPMANFISLMNDDFKPDVVVDGGDLVDGKDKREKELYPVVQGIFEDLKAPSYHILGNHETRGFLKEDWLEFTGYEKPYYFQDIREYRLIFLDGNNKPSENGQSIDTMPEVRYYPGHLDNEQEKWLEKTLRESEDKIVLVFVHQPPLEKTLLKESKELFVNGERIRNLFSKYKVAAVFSGHIEEMCYIEDDDVDYYVLEGVHKNNRQLLAKDDYKDQGVFYQITLNKQEGVEVKMFHKSKDDKEYQTFLVDEKSAICNNESIKNPETYEALVDQEVSEK